MKNYYFVIYFILFSQIAAKAQEMDEDALPFHFYIGIQTRVTPIEVKRTPDFMILQDRNIMEQPNKHLSGPSFIYRLEKEISSKVNISFSQSIRYDFLYQTLPFNNQPIEGFSFETKKGVFTDLYLEGEYKYTLRSSTLKTGIGIALCGVGSNYLLTQRYVDNNNQSFYITSKENFVFPAVSASLGWQKGKFDAKLRMGYTWEDPTWFETPFLFPELGVNYRIFSF